MRRHLAFVGDVGIVAVRPAGALEVVDEVLADRLGVAGQAKSLLRLVLLRVVRGSLIVLSLKVEARNMHKIYISCG
jgi:hypothetical protein